MELCEEAARAQFGDLRLSRRLVTILEQIVPEPDASFPVAAGGDAALEATYRFLNNESVCPEAILAPHIGATARRAAAQGTTIVAHDTTELELKSEHVDVGRLSSGRKGFLAHVALALSADGARRPLGILGLRTIFRDRAPRERAHRKRRSQAGDSEEQRWIGLVNDVECALNGSASAIHVMDCEADSYRLFTELVAEQRRFVIRMTFNRLVVTELGESIKVGAAICNATAILEREVPIAARKAKREVGQKSNPPREARTAKLSISAQHVTLLRSQWAGKDYPRELRASVVRVWEPHAPPGIEAIEWRLLTTEKVDTADDVARVVDAYRARWVIEEYFKALKTGCAIERRQLENRRALLNALAIYAPIACQLLLLRSLARKEPSEPATSALSPLHLRLLEKHPKLRLPKGATVQKAMLAIAQLGGHIKNNGDPGWIVLSRGYEKLLLLEEGARLVM
jgi:hypothetical protein